MIKNTLFPTIFILCIAFLTAETFASDNDEANSYIKESRHFEAGDALKEVAISADPAKEKASVQPGQPANGSQNHLLSSRLAAVYAVENWTTAWTKQNIEEYFNAYGTHFVPPPGVDLRQWQKQRRRSLTAPKFIRINIKDLVVEATNGDQLLVTFRQSYESDTYRDVVIKALTMEKESEGWKIVQERQIRRISP